EFFSALGAEPLLGRTFRPDEDHHGSEFVVVVSYSFWHSHLNADPAAIGRSITLDGKPYTIVGVMPAAFSFPRPGHNDRWALEVLAPPTARPPYYLTAFGRLKPGVSPKQAQAELTTIALQVTQQFPTSAYQAASIQPLKEFMVGKVRLPLLVLLAAVS